MLLGSWPRSDCTSSRWFAAGADLGARHTTGRLRGGMSAPVLGLAKGSSRKQYPEVAFKGSRYGRLEVRRGDIVTIVLPGAYGKPRPALVVQSDLFDTLASVTVLPVTSELRTAPLLRISIEPNTDNG